METVTRNDMDKEIFKFGKYKGIDIDKVIHSGSRYAQWAEENVSFFSLSSVQKETLTEEIEKLNLKNETRLLMHNYGMHTTEAMNFSEYDYPEYF